MSWSRSGHTRYAGRLQTAKGRAGLIAPVQYTRVVDQNVTTGAAWVQDALGILKTALGKDTVGTRTLCVYRAIETDTDFPATAARVAALDSTCRKGL